MFGFLSTAIASCTSPGVPLAPNGEPMQLVDGINYKGVNGGLYQWKCDHPECPDSHSQFPATVQHYLHENSGYIICRKCWDGTHDQAASAAKKEAPVVAPSNAPSRDDAKNLIFERMNGDSVTALKIVWEQVSPRYAKKSRARSSGLSKFFRIPKTERTSIFNFLQNDDMKAGDVVQVQGEIGEYAVLNGCIGYVFRRVASVKTPNSTAALINDLHAGEHTAMICLVVSDKLKQLKKEKKLPDNVEAWITRQRGGIPDSGSDDSDDNDEFDEDDPYSWPTFNARFQKKNLKVLFSKGSVVVSPRINLSARVCNLIFADQTKKPIFGLEVNIPAKYELGKDVINFDIIMQSDKYGVDLRGSNIIDEFLIKGHPRYWQQKVSLHGQSLRIGWDCFALVGHQGEYNEKKRGKTWYLQCVLTPDGHLQIDPSMKILFVGELKSKLEMCVLHDHDMKDPYNHIAQMVLTEQEYECEKQILELWPKVRSYCHGAKIANAMHRDEAVLVNKIVSLNRQLSVLLSGKEENIFDDTQAVHQIRNEVKLKYNRNDNDAY